MKKKTKQNIIMLLIVLILVLVPFVVAKGGSFAGSDDEGTAQIKKNDPHYKVWIHPLWTPPSAEIESLLFTVQGSFGTGVIAYILGSAHGRKKERARQIHTQNEAGKARTETSAANGR
ncbi:energy-coupling factor ABC transporter substrate-binding protein [Secundilactobacillus silagei]|uniref:Cobalt transport protein CbiN n=1 Tax=Secundilactobacillus silagei JCM 19001 TaxID=1302250 RepID=A0A1Z5IFF2_9LACO|nr:energy-coupling factor ABC transporter substrate-binding protein [Secundilactobacillus silagei]TDG72072.1 hypothetical protein C5L25_002456 [Secundilactobacillus silagei JCM 19001]GAX00490.1 cobalt ABC transporter permease protein CbiN [Secundilactobacillus silagei JCM 19001]